MKQTKACPHCAGTGKILDQAAIGSEMRALRNSARLTGREVSRRLKLSASYLSDLELGRRNWSGDLIERYTEACKK